MAFSSASDPLGIAVMGRAAQARRRSEDAGGMWRHLGPLPDPQWDGFFQAAQEAGTTEFGGVDPSMLPSPAETPLPAHQQSAGAGMRPSRHIASAALDGFRRATQR